MADYKFDIFISYSSIDALWANRLKELYENAGLKVFLDSVRILPGRDWYAALDDALEQSRNMVLLWSDKAKASAWVSRETNVFHHSRRTNPQSNFICVVLNDEPQLFNRLQSIEIIKKNALYESTPANVPVEIWNQIVTETLKGINENDPRKPIRRLVLTLNVKEFNDLDFDKPPPFGRSPTELGFKKVDFIDRYGPNRRNWKPFGGEGRTAIEILDTILQSINQENNIQYKWMPLDENRIFSRKDRDGIISEKKFLETEPSVMVVDPIFLFDETYRATFTYLQDCLKNRNALVMVLPLFEPPEIYQRWRTAIEYCAGTFHTKYFKPPVSEPKDYIAEYSANPIDLMDARGFIQRLLWEIHNNGGGFNGGKPSQLKHS